MEEILLEALSNSGNDVESSTDKKALSRRLDYDECLRLLLDVGAQIELLRENNIGILSVTKQDIMQLSHGGFMINPDILSFKCDNNGQIRVDKPFQKVKGMAPELEKIETLPTTVSYTVAYFSLKQLALDLLDIQSLSQLEPTKMFYLLERCSRDDPKDRTFVLI